MRAVDTKPDIHRDVEPSSPASNHDVKSSAHRINPNRSEVAAFIERSRKAIATGKTDVAYEESDKAVKLAPNSSRAWNTKGRAALSRSNYAEAIAAFAKAVELNHDNAWAWNNLGYAELMLGRYQAAATHLEQATKHPAATGYMFNNLGLALENLHRLDEARSAFEKAAKLGSDKAAASARRLERVTESPPTPQQSKNDSGEEPLTASARAYQAHLARVHRDKSVLELAQEEQANWLKETQHSSNIISILFRGLRNALGIPEAETTPTSAPMHDHSHGPDDHSHGPDDHSHGPDDHSHDPHGHTHDPEPRR